MGYVKAKRRISQSRPAILCGFKFVLITRVKGLQPFSPSCPCSWHKRIFTCYSKDAFPAVNGPLSKSCFCLKRRQLSDSSLGNGFCLDCRLWTLLILRVRGKRAATFHFPLEPFSGARFLKAVVYLCVTPLFFSKQWKRPRSFVGHFFCGASGKRTKAAQQKSLHRLFPMRPPASLGVRNVFFLMSACLLTGCVVPSKTLAYLLVPE